LTSGYGQTDPIFPPCEYADEESYSPLFFRLPRMVMGDWTYGAIDGL